MNYFPGKHTDKKFEEKGKASIQNESARTYSWGSMVRTSFRSLVSSQSTHDKVKNMIASVLKCKGKSESGSKCITGGLSSGEQFNGNEMEEGSGEERRAADLLVEALSTDCYLVSAVPCLKIIVSKNTSSNTLITSPLYLSSLLYFYLSFLSFSLLLSSLFSLLSPSLSFTHSLSLYPFSNSLLFVL